MLQPPLWNWVYFQIPFVTSTLTSRMITSIRHWCFKLYTLDLFEVGGINLNINGKCIIILYACRGTPGNSYLQGKCRIISYIFYLVTQFIHEFMPQILFVYSPLLIHLLPRWFIFWIIIVNFITLDFRFVKSQLWLY